MLGHRNSGAGQLSRALLTSVDDSGPQQLVAVTGLQGQIIGEAVRSQHFGLTSNPPANAEGLMLMLGGGADRAHLLGLEHPQYRPTGLKSGESMFYDQWGNSVKSTNGVMTVMHASNLVLKVGACSLTVTSSGFAFAGGSITHDGHLIDKTHVHTDAGGAGLSGPPP